MNDDDAAALSSSLRTILEENRLNWVVSQVDETLDEGITETVEKDSFESEEKGTGRGRRRKQEFFTQRPYDRAEDVLLLLEAARRALIDIPEMAVEIQRVLSPNEGAPRSIRFVSETREASELAVKRLAETQPSPRLVEVLNELIVEVSH